MIWSRPSAANVTLYRASTPAFTRAIDSAASKPTPPMPLPMPLASSPSAKPIPASTPTKGQASSALFSPPKTANPNSSSPSGTKFPLPKLLSISSLGPTLRTKAFTNGTSGSTKSTLIDPRVRVMVTGAETTTLFSSSWSELLALSSTRGPNAIWFLAPNAENRYGRWKRVVNENVGSLPALLLNPNLPWRSNSAKKRASPLP